MADAKPNTAKPDAKPPKERKKLTAAVAMVRFERMMNELDEDGKFSLQCFVVALGQKRPVLPPTGASP